MRTLLVLCGLIAAQPAPTLRSQIDALQLPLPRDAAGLDSPMTSGKVFEDASAVVFAYYEIVPDGQLHALHVRAFDKRRRTWRAVTFSHSIGAVIDIRRGAGVFYVVGHESPSGGPLLVLTETLARRRTLDGWPMLVLKDGRLIFNRSMRHFAPTHAEVLAIYDPRRNGEQTLYPRGTDNDRGAERTEEGLWIDRSFGKVSSSTNGRAVVFTSTTTLNRLDASGAAHPRGPEIRRRVVCDVSTPPRLACRASRVG